MGDDDRIERLELEIAELRKELGSRREVAAISAEEIKAYLKVRDVIAVDYGEFCGINDCFRCISICRVCQVCAVCQVCRVCRVCDVECSCGPCNVGGRVESGVSRFGGLGG